MTMAERAQDVLETMEMLSPEERFEYLADIGKEHVTKSTFTDADIVKGCQAQVWFVGSVENGTVTVDADSDAIMVRGLVALIVNLYNGATLQEAREFDFFPWFERCGIGLSMRRTQGLHAVMQRVKFILA